MTLSTFLVDTEPDYDAPTVRCDCPETCTKCIDACPRNQAVLKKAVRRDALLEELKSGFNLEKVLLLDEEYYEETVKPVMYNSIRGRNIFRRNAAIALGNTGDPSHLPALRKAFEMYDNAELKETIQWAIHRLEAGKRKNEGL